MISFHYLLSPYGWGAIALAVGLSLSAGCTSYRAPTRASLYPMGYEFPSSGVVYPADYATTDLRTVTGTACTSDNSERSRLCAMNLARAAVGLPPLSRLP